MDTLLNILIESWDVTRQMAPYLLFGFGMAGFLSVFISAETVERHLGKRGFGQVLKAALLGVPLPLCSCSVVPVSASLYRHGASKGATLSFLASTPQTGVDSIAVTWSLMGPVVTLFRIIAAFVSGLLAGVGVELLPDDATPATAAAPDEEDACCCENRSQSRLRRAYRYGFVTLPQDIGRSMLFGLLLSGLLGALIPANYFADRIGSGLVAMLLMMLIGIPIYTCSSGSVPVALGLMRAGLSPGAALVFLVTGPATNAATVTTIVRLLGKRATAIYLGCIAATALGMGLLLDLFVTRGAFAAPDQSCGSCVDGVGLLDLWAILLLVMLLPSCAKWLPRRFRGAA